jgi:hypothetical protein
VLEAEVRSDLSAHFAFLSMPHRVRVRIYLDGRLTLVLEVTTRDFARPAEVAQLARTLSRGLDDFLRVHYPRLVLAPASRLRIVRPYSFTESLPTLAATLAAPPAAVVGGRESGDDDAGDGASAAAVAKVAHTAREVDVRERLGRALSRRYIVKQLTVTIPAEGQALVRCRIAAMSQDRDRDADRLLRAARTVVEALSVIDSLAPASGSAVELDAYRQSDGKRTHHLRAVSDGRAFALAGRDRSERPSGPDPGRPRPEAAPSASAPPPEVPPGSPPRDGAPERSVPDVNDDPGHERVRRRRPDPYKRPSVPRRPPSFENLVEIPSSIVPPKDSVYGRLEMRARRLTGGEYSATTRVRNLDLGESISVATAKNLQATVRYTRLRQTSDLVGLPTDDGIGNSFTMSLKYQAPPALRRNTHLAVGTDFSVSSREDRAIRTPDDFKQTESFWAAYDVWTSHISVLHFMIRRVGLYSREPEFTQVGLASELFAHHPLRRFYVEVVGDDRQDKVFRTFGRALQRSVYVNAGLEAALGRTGSKTSVVVNVPHVLASRYREVTVNVVRRF